MRLSKIGLLAVKGASPDIIQKLADALNREKSTVYEYVSTNDDMLTKAAALKVIREETGLSDDQILEQEPVNEATK